MKEEKKEKRMKFRKGGDNSKRMKRNERKRR